MKFFKFAVRGTCEKGLLWNGDVLKTSGLRNEQIKNHIFKCNNYSSNDFNYLFALEL